MFKNGLSLLYFSLTFLMKSHPPSKILLKVYRLKAACYIVIHFPITDKHFFSLKVFHNPLFVWSMKFSIFDKVSKNQMEVIVTANHTVKEQSNKPINFNLQYLHTN